MTLFFFIMQGLHLGPEEIEEQHDKCNNHNGLNAHGYLTEMAGRVHIPVSDSGWSNNAEIDIVHYRIRFVAQKMQAGIDNREAEGNF